MTNTTERGEPETHLQNEPALRPFAGDGHPEWRSALTTTRDLPGEVHLLKREEQKCTVAVVAPLSRVEHGRRIVLEPARRNISAFKMDVRVVQIAKRNVEARVTAAVAHALGVAPQNGGRPTPRVGENGSVREPVAEELSKAIEIHEKSSSARVWLPLRPN